MSSIAGCSSSTLDGKLVNLAPDGPCELIGNLAAWQLLFATHLGPLAGNRRLQLEPALDGVVIDAGEIEQGVDEHRMKSRGRAAGNGGPEGRFPAARNRPQDEAELREPAQNGIQE